MRLSLAVAAAVSGIRAAAGTGLDLVDFTDEEDAVLSKWYDICGQSTITLLLSLCDTFLYKCAILRVQCVGMFSTVSC